MTGPAALADTQVAHSFRADKTAPHHFIDELECEVRAGMCMGSATPYGWGMMLLHLLQGFQGWGCACTQLLVQGAKGRLLRRCCRWWRDAPASPWAMTGCPTPPG